MSNNDLYCHKCKSHHHPVDCPLDVSKEKDWLVEVIKEYRILPEKRLTSQGKKILYDNFGTDQDCDMDALADSIRQELVRRIEGKKKFYCEIHGIKQRRDKCIRCCETFMYREAIDEIIKEIS